MGSVIRGNDDFDSAVKPAVTTVTQPSRSRNTWYQNTTGKTMHLCIQTSGWNGKIYMGSSTSSYMTITYNAAGGSGAYEQDAATVAVPPNWYYYYVHGNHHIWTEMY